jgi:tetratricopeptide (TPR) repeat protein
VSAGAAVEQLAHAVASQSSADPLVKRRRYMASGAMVVGLVLALWPAALDDGRTEERTRMALWLIGQGRYDEAAARTSALEQEAADPGMLHFRVGRAFLAREQIDAAVRHLARARDLGSKAPDADLLLGQALVAARRPKEAIPPLRRAFEAGVRRDVSGFELARAHAATGDRAGAVRVLQTVRPERPDDAQTWRRLGELALHLQVPRLGEAFLRQAVRADPSSGEALEQLGLALALSGRFEEAAGTFEKAVGANPSDASARLNLAVALAEIGRIDEARRHAEEALGLEPSYAKAREFLSKLPRSAPH